MQRLRGVVRGRVIVLQDGAQLTDGTTVEVEVVAEPERLEPELSVDRRLRRRLQEAGLLTEVGAQRHAPAASDRTPATVVGRPLSEEIIEERR